MEQREALRLALVEWAKEARKNSYCPYSGFAVGAALLCADGSVYAGCNIENAGFTATCCAERTALVKAVSEGERQFAAIAIVGSMEGHRNTLITSPCGVCRQMLFEFGGPQLIVIMAKSETDYEEMTLDQLLPLGFGPDNLQ